MQDSIDVAGIMRTIREGTRARHEEITRRIARTQKQLEEQIPQVFDDRLRRLFRAQSEMFNRYYERMIVYLAEQEPNYVNIRRTLSEVSRLIEEPGIGPGPRDRWWNPRWWMKRLLAPVRRFVLRRQNELNAVMRDTLIYLFNHSAHVETQRIELELGIQMLQMMEILLDQLEVSRRYFQEWLRVSMPPITDYVEELQEEAAQKQTAVIAEVQNALGKRLDQFGADWALRLEKMNSQVRDGERGKTTGTLGFDSLRFADSVRGSPEEVRRQQAMYLDYLRGQQNILDAGCGRGEFLELLRDRGISGYGVDCDEAMVRYCRERGLDVRYQDIVEHLAELPEDSLGGLVAFQVVEHLDFSSFLQMLRLAARKIRPGGVLILETVNPKCLTTFSGAFYADPTHIRPIHPEALGRLLEIVGFADATIEYLNPIGEPDNLKLLPADTVSDSTLRGLVDAMNQNIRRINSLLYGHADYALVARKVA